MFDKRKVGLKVNAINVNIHQSYLILISTEQLIPALGLERKSDSEKVIDYRD